MRKLTFLLAILAVAAVSAHAQEKPRFNPDLSWNTLRAEYGYWTPMDFTEFQQSIDPLTDRPVGAPSEKPVHWYFSISGGISWLF